MFLNAILFSKLQKIYQQISKDNNQYFLTFAPLATYFSNIDFNFLNPNSDSADDLRQNAENKMAFAEIANPVVCNEKIFQLNNDNKLSDAYAKILNDAILIDTTVSDEDKLAYTTARSVLFINDNLDNTEAYQNYKISQKKYLDLDDQIFEINNLLSQDTENSAELIQQKKDLELKLNVTLNDWLILGNKEKIENALNIVYGLNSHAKYKSDFNLEQNSFKNSFTKENTINSNIEYLPTFCLPNNIYNYEFNGWKKIAITNDEIAKLESDARAFLGNDLYDANSASGNTSVSKIEFEYLFVSIQRNWFKKSIVNSSFWKFSDNTVVSDGSNLNVGILPAIIDKFVFVRRITQYLLPATNEPIPVIQNIAPPTYQFNQIAKLKNFALIKDIKPQEAPVARFKMADLPVKTNVTAAVSRPMMHKSAFLPRPELLNVNEKLHVRNNILARDIAPVKENVKPNLVFFNPDILINFRPVQTETNNIPPALFSFVLNFKDAGANAITLLDIMITNTATGMQYSAETDNNGNANFTNMPSGNYHLQIQNNELYQDFEATYNINAATTLNISLAKRQNPKYDMWLIGAINYKFPQLPNPLNNFTYS